MRPDKLLLLSDGQTLTATGASTNVIDTTLDRNIGIGEALAIAIVATERDDDDGNESYKATLQTSNAENFGSGVVSLGEVTIDKTGIFSLPVPKDDRTLRYLRVNYTLGGTTPSLTVDAYLTGHDDIDGGGTFNRGYTISG